MLHIGGSAQHHAASRWFELAPCCKQVVHDSTTQEAISLDQHHSVSRWFKLHHAERKWFKPAPYCKQVVQSNTMLQAPNGSDKSLVNLDAEEHLLVMNRPKAWLTIRILQFFKVAIFEVKT